MCSKLHGTACWVAGWGKDQSNGVSSDVLKSIGVNLFDHEYCMKHRFVKTFFTKLVTELSATILTMMISFSMKMNYALVYLIIQDKEKT